MLRLCVLGVAVLLAGAARAEEGFVSDLGDDYVLVANPDGMILSSVHPKAWLVEAGAASHVERGNDVIFLGKSCDVFHRLWGKGSWGQANGGFRISFPDGRDYSFPRQELPVADDIHCGL